MHGCMVVGWGANKFSISRYSEDALDALQIDWAHMLHRFDKLLLAQAFQQSFLALQCGYSCHEKRSPLTVSPTLISPYGYIHCMLDSQKSQGGLVAFSVFEHEEARRD